MKYLKNITLAVVFLFCASFTFFHHGWANYNQEKVLDFKATIEQSVYENPHALLKVKYSGKLWTVYLAPTSRMTDRGLSAEMIRKGASVRIVAYPHKTVETEMRAERVYVGDQKFELR